MWDVAFLPEAGLMLTASADRTIKMWKTGKCEKTFVGKNTCCKNILNSKYLLLLRKPKILCLHEHYTVRLLFRSFGLCSGLGGLVCGRVLVVFKRHNRPTLEHHRRVFVRLSRPQQLRLLHLHFPKLRSICFFWRRSKRQSNHNSF